MGWVWLGAVVYKMAKVRVLYPKPQPNTTTSQQPTWAAAALPSSGFALSLSPWVEQRHHQIMVPLLPYTIRMPRAIGLVLAVVGLLSWGGGGEMRGIKKRERRVCLGLRWPPFNKFHPTIRQQSASAMDGELGKKRDKGGVCGGTPYFCFGCQIDWQK